MIKEWIETIRIFFFLGAIAGSFLMVAIILGIALFHSVPSYLDFLIKLGVVDGFVILIGFWDIIGFKK